MSRDDEEYEEPEVVYIVDEAVPVAWTSELNMPFLEMTPQEAQALLEQYRAYCAERTQDVVLRSHRSWHWSGDE